MKLKIEWAEFLEIAALQIQEIYPTAKTNTLTFMKKYGHDPDGECYDLPDYIEVEL